MTVNGIAITAETITLTRQHYINNCNACIMGARNGEFKVNDLDKYIEWQERCKTRTRNGENDHTLSFLQTALWLQTGKAVAILS